MNDQMKQRSLCAIAGLLALPLVAFAAGPATTASATFSDAAGKSLGTAQLEAGSGGTLISLDLKGLPPGPKAIHIHALGHCDDGAAGFKHSGSHLNPDSAQHGLKNPNGPDAGDLPNIHVAADGSVKVEMFTTLAQLSGDSGAVILDKDGAALVIHANADDHTSQPIGGAGDRIACAVIKKS